MSGGHMQVCDVPLAVARRRQFAADALPAFEKAGVVSVRKGRRAEQSGGAAADDNRCVFFHDPLIVPLLAHKVKFIENPLNFFSFLY